MGGVDLGDQLRGYYHVRSTTNAYILYSFDVRTGTPMTLKQFRMKLAEQLIGTYKSRKRIGRPRKRPCPTSNPNPNSQTAHLPTHSSSSVRCVYCRQVRSPPRRKHTVWVCGECEGNPPLCLTGRNDGSDCFRLWHQQ